MEHPLRLGHLLIDQQHADLFHCIGSLHSLQGRLCDDSKIQQFLSTLAEMLSTHFLTEESLMLEINLPAPIFAAHRADHHQILSGLNSLYESGRHGARYDLSDVCKKAKIWVSDHVEIFDQPLLHYYKAGGR